MRMMLKVTVPVEAGNKGIKDGSLARTIQSTTDRLKPEAAYFLADEGSRTALFFFNMQDASQIPGIAEPLFMGGVLLHHFLKPGRQRPRAPGPQELRLVGRILEQALGEAPDLARHLVRHTARPTRAASIALLKAPIALRFSTVIFSGWNHDRAFSLHPHRIRAR